MNLFAVTYDFNNEYRTLLIESEYSSVESVKAELHPAISNKVTDIEFVGTIA